MYTDIKQKVSEMLHDMEGKDIAMHTLEISEAGFVNAIKSAQISFKSATEHSILDTLLYTISKQHLVRN